MWQYNRGTLCYLASLRSIQGYHHILPIELSTPPYKKYFTQTFDPGLLSIRIPCQFYQSHNSWLCYHCHIMNSPISFHCSIYFLFWLHHSSCGYSLCGVANQMILKNRRRYFLVILVCIFAFADTITIYLFIQPFCSNSFIKHGWYIGCHVSQTSWLKQKQKKKKKNAYSLLYQ